MLTLRNVSNSDMVWQAFLTTFLTPFPKGTPTRKRKLKSMIAHQEYNSCSLFFELDFSCSGA